MFRFTAIAVWMMPFAAPACLICDSALGREVQGEVFNGSFAQTAAAVLLPFPLFLLAGAVLNFAIPRWLNRNNRN